MPQTDWGWLITPSEFQSWLLFLSPELAAVNKPGLVVCHPSKHGPWSSLIGAAREVLHEETLHMPSRLDRETSGVVLFARNPTLGSQLQRAIQHRRVSKTYTAILDGILPEPLTVDRPIARSTSSPVFLKQEVHPDGQPAQTDFIPPAHSRRHTLARIHPHTGRLHQIRVHAASIGHPVTADKLYGPDETLFLHFLEHGYDDTLRQSLPLPRQALHASSITFDLPDGPLSFEAPFAPDLAVFWSSLETP